MLVGKEIKSEEDIRKCRGQAIYLADKYCPGMLWGGILRSPYAHALIKSVNTKKAENLPGVEAVLTFDRCPKRKYNCAGSPPSANIVKDEYVISEKMRFVGDKVAAIAAKDENTLIKALSLIEVEYEILPFYLHIDDAITNGSAEIHEGVKNNINKIIALEYGDVEDGFKNTDRIFEGVYTTHTVQGAPLEPCSCIASYSSEGKLTVLSNTQTPHQDKRNLSEILDIPESHIRCIQEDIGGGFGSRQQMHQQPVAALLSKITRKPVRMIHSREEDLISAVRHGSKIRIRTGVDSEGNILAMDVDAYINTGAYATHGPMVLSAMKARLPYSIKNYKFTGYSVYTNLPPAGALRGYGNPQFTFARENHFDEIAEELGMDSIEFRLKNHIKTGQSIPGINWQVESCGIKECVNKATEAKNKIIIKDSPGLLKGWGASFCLHGSGIAERDVASGLVIINDDGSINVITGAVEIGQGSNLTLRQIVASELGIADLSMINIYSSDTAYTPYDTGAFGSRQLYMDGKALQLAAKDARIKLFKKAEEILGLDAGNLECEDGFIYKIDNREQISSFTDLVKDISFRTGAQNIIGTATFKPGSSPPPFAFCLALVEVNAKTGEIKAPHIIMSIDVGKAINPGIVKGQIMGGALMGQAYAISEEIDFSPEKGLPINSGFMSYGFPVINEDINIIVNIVESYEPTGPFGAKSVGEISLIPVAAAIANGFYQATGIRLKDIPASPKNILKLLDKKR